MGAPTSHTVTLELDLPIFVVMKIHPEVIPLMICILIDRNYKEPITFILFDEHKFIRIHVVCKSVLCLFGFRKDKCWGQFRLWVCH